tara:strand:- start:2005 stop:2499 length:495 start_codon:yes stop_codon:yes gene_type:complete
LSEDSKQARACQSAYPLVRDEVLRAHPWNSAIARASLAKLSDAPSFGYAAQYQLPADCLRVVEVYDIPWPWVVEGRRLLTDGGSPLDIRYVRREEDVNQWDALLVNAVAARLAMELCEELTQSNTKRQIATQEYEGFLSRARGADGQESSPMPFEEDSWINARY